MEEQIKESAVDQQQEYVINMGPQHPSTHGVLRLVVSLRGEIVKNVEPHVGYVHRGIEKITTKFRDNHHEGLRSLAHAGKTPGDRRILCNLLEQA